MCKNNVSKRYIVQTRTSGEIMIFGRKQEWRDNNINIMYVHRGHGHVRPELTDKAYSGGRIIKKK